MPRKDVDLPRDFSEEFSSTQEFSAFMREFIGRVGARTVVEVGPDVQLLRASRIAPACAKYIAFTLPRDAPIMENWLELLDYENVEVVGGNAVDLSLSVPHADIILLHGVVLDLTGEDTNHITRYQRGEEKLTDVELSRLGANFREARAKSYLEFMKVAHPGFIVVFQRAADSEAEGLDEFIVQFLHVPPERIETRKLLHDQSKELWEVHIIDNGFR